MWLQGEIVQRVTGACAGLHVVASVQHQSERVLARLHVPQNAARR